MSWNKGTQLQSSPHFRTYEVEEFRPDGCVINHAETSQEILRSITLWWDMTSKSQLQDIYISATSSLQPQPAGAASANLDMPYTSQIRITMFLTALTSSIVAPPFNAPLRCPFNWGLTFHESESTKPKYARDKQCTYILRYQSCNQNVTTFCGI